MKIELTAHYANSEASDTLCQVARAKGTPLYTVAELMGHTTLEMTRRYSHLAPDSLRKAALSLQGSLEKEQGSS